MWYLVVFRVSGSCGHDGVYIQDADSLVLCSNGIAYYQPCSPGTKNSGYNSHHDDHYTSGSYYNLDVSVPNITMHSIQQRTVTEAGIKAGTCTVRCRYNALSFLQCPYKRHPIARPRGRDIWCLLWFTFCHCNRSAVCNTVMTGTAL